jgi:immune inhibitor A
MFHSHIVEGPVRKTLTVLFSLSLIFSAVAAPVAAGAPPEEERPPQTAPVSDKLPNPLADAQFAARQEALQRVLQGKLEPVGDNQVVELESSTAQPTGSSRNHQYRHHRDRIFVELARTDEHVIWSLLAEFGNQIHPVTLGDPGPVHNQIPRPDRRVDNTSIWTSDFDVDYYDDTLFSQRRGAVSMYNYYVEQSSNRFGITGTVEDWTPVSFNEARYGTNICGSIVCTTVWDLITHSTTAWYNARMAEGMSAAEINAYLAQFDIWDRYDYDGDGDFDEPDGYIDHFQNIHAGVGEETGGGAQGEDAIWSHSWYAFYTNIGVTGPAFNPAGGIKIGGSNIWIGDYTMEPEDSGVGVFAHEFGHDIGLPDLYDTSGNTGGAENSTGFWTIMSSGSYGSTGRPRDGIGTKPVGMGAYEKILLGWSNYEVVFPGDEATIELGPAFFNSKYAHHIIVLLPDKEVVFPIGDPYSGAWQYFSDVGNNLDNTMTRSVTLPAAPVTLSAKAKYDTEVDFDYWYVTVNGEPVDTNLSVCHEAAPAPGSACNPFGQNFGFGINGSSGGNWIDLQVDLAAFAGQTVDIGFRYWTDAAVVEDGVFLDDILISGQPLDDAETDPGWAYDGFARVGASVTQSFFNAYFVENRTYGGYDKSLKTGPYNFGFLDDPDLQNWVEHFPYQDGMLVSYYDESFADNNVGDHCLAGRCGGLILPVDAHPQLLIRPDGQVWRPRIQSFDSTFGLDKTDKICLHMNSVKVCHPKLSANPKFDDSQSYWVPPNPAIGHFGWSSVPVPNTGTTIRVKSVHQGGNVLNVWVNK